MVQTVIRPTTSLEDSRHNTTSDAPAATPFEASVQKLRDAGYRITKARLTVLEVLYEQGGHLTSTEILSEVDRRAPSVGRASVFRTLEMLTAMAIIRPTYLTSRTPTYVVLSQQGHHSHIICTRCEAVIELEGCHVEGVAEKLEANHDVQVTGHLLEFYGLCADCDEPNGSHAHTKS